MSGAEYVGGGADATAGTSVERGESKIDAPGFPRRGRTTAGGGASSLAGAQDIDEEGQGGRRRKPAGQQLVAPVTSSLAVCRMRERMRVQ